MTHTENHPSIFLNQLRDRIGRAAYEVETTVRFLQEDAELQLLLEGKQSCSRLETRKVLIPQILEMIAQALLGAEDLESGRHRSRQ